MRTREEYVKLAVAALSLEWGSEGQIDAENEICRIAKNDRLPLPPSFESLKATVQDRIVDILIARVDADYTNHPPRMRNRG